MSALRVLLTIMLAAYLGAVMAQASPPAVDLQIEAQPVDHALKEFAAQSGMQVLFHVEGTQIPAGLKSGPVHGRYTAEAALEKLLANTGLRYEFINERTVTIRAGQVRAGLMESLGGTAPSQHLAQS